jgi:hypothetical protein
MVSGSAAPAFFDMFFRGQAPSAPSARPYADPNADIRRSAPRHERRNAAPASRPGGTTYCVRLCDGRHFPMNFQGGGPELCKAMCPASPTQVFSGSSIAEAYSPAGKRYSDIPNAFLYRDRLVEDCTCNGKSPLGLARLDIVKDDSLRQGDILATLHGFMAYRGNTRRYADFIPLDMKQLPKAARDRLAETAILPEPVARAPAETTGSAPASREPDGRSSSLEQRDDFVRQRQR